MTAAGIIEAPYGGCPVELGRMGFEPSSTQIDIADGGRIARLRRLPEIKGGHHNTPGRQRLVGADIISPVPVVPGTAVHVDDGGKRPRSFGLIDTGQPCRALPAWW